MAKVGLVYAVCYLIFYILVLDYIGAHLYFILSPRKWWPLAEPYKYVF